MNGLFFVTKKNDKQRMILDAKPANWYFREPPTTQNASGSSFASLRVPEDKELYIANYDVKDFLYRLGIDEELGKWFGLPAFSSKAFVKLFGVDPTPELHPDIDSVRSYFIVLPMVFLGHVILLLPVWPVVLAELFQIPGSSMTTQPCLIQSFDSC